MSKLTEIESSFSNASCHISFLSKDRLLEVGKVQVLEENT